MANASSNPGYFPAPLGATGSSLPLLGGLIRIAELRAGYIDHALAIAIPNVKAGSFVWPAQRTDGNTNSPTAIPEGTRLRLDPTLDVNALGLPAAARTIALAAQRYGIVVRDVSGAVTFYAEDPTPTGSNPYPALFGNRYPDQLLARFPWSRLQVTTDQGATSLPQPPAPAPAPAPATAVAAAAPAPAGSARAPKAAKPSKRGRAAHRKTRSRHARRAKRQGKRGDRKHASGRTTRHKHHRRTARR
jgi:hypothetical protein